MRSDRILAVLSGFDPGKTPGIGTFYDFVDRFWLIKHPQIVDKLAAQAVKGREPFPLRAERLIQEVFARCFVDRSVELGLIPDPLALVLSGDGSSVRTGASPYGVKVCDCRKKGVFNCDCKRRFADPQARWGWDSYRMLHPSRLMTTAFLCVLKAFLWFSGATRKTVTA
ncbi:MAG: hypothetical protein H0Z40_11435 [Desulfotomaculum sp.]|nr:hypothetical protein [Desulfotomaculum sp.]